MKANQRETEITRLLEEAEYYSDVALWALRASCQPDSSEKYWDETFKKYHRMSQKRRAEARRLQGE